jgi:Holliday junction resolvase RusA-like endonuclease
MTPEEITIVLPLPNKVLQPNCTIGSFGGRMMKAAAAKKYRRLAREAIEAEQIENLPWKKVSVHAIFYHANNRKRDQDNAMGALKAAYDGITESKLVADDDYLHMNQGIPEFKIDKEFPRVTLKLIRLE